MLVVTENFSWQEQTLKFKCATVAVQHHTHAHSEHRHTAAWHLLPSNAAKIIEKLPPRTENLSPSFLYFSTRYTNFAGFKVENLYFFFLPHL